MSLASVGCYQPVARKENLDRLVVFLPSSELGRELWTEIHDEVQEQLAPLERDVRQRLVGVRVDAGRTNGDMFFLFSYLTFSVPESGLDPVVVGMTFRPAGPGVVVDADASGEQTGDLISDRPSTSVENSREALLSAVREWRGASASLPTISPSPLRIHLAELSEPMSQIENAQKATAGQVLSLQEKEEFIRRALSRMAPYTFGFICSVLGVCDSKTGRHYGTALRCKLNGRRAILTALRVIEEARKEPLGLALSTGYGERPYVVHGAVNIDPIADLAVYFLPEDYPCPDERFWPSAHVDRSRDKLATDYLFLHGFPGTASYPSPLLMACSARPFRMERCSAWKTCRRICSPFSSRSSTTLLGW